MRTPFYETDFDIKEYISKRILEMDSLSDRILYKEMTESFMLLLFEMQQEVRCELVQKVISEVSILNDSFDVSVGMIETSKFDGTDTFLYPIISENIGKVSITDINVSLENQTPYYLENIYYNSIYPNIEKLNGHCFFKGTITTSEKEYEATFLVTQDTRYIDKITNLYKAFCNNGAIWNTVVLSHLIRTFSVSIYEVKSQQLQGDFINFSIDFAEYEKEIIRDVLPLWNISMFTETTSSFPISVDGGVKYKHSILLENKRKGSKLIVGNLDSIFYAISENKNEMSIICNERHPKEWQFYEVCVNTKRNTYNFPVLSNFKKQSLTDDLRSKYQRNIGTKAELYRVVKQSPFSDKVKLLGFEIPDSYKNTSQTYDMNQFYTDQVEMVGTKKVLLLTFETINKEDYLVYDYMSYITTMMVESFPHYHIIGELVGV